MADRRARSFPPGMRRRARMRRDGTRPRTGLAGLSIAALGVVFGDIGTSPVYTFRECFNPEHGLPLSPENVLGVLSLIVWALILVVAMQIRLADHARRQPRRGRDSRVAGPCPGGGAKPPHTEYSRPGRARRGRAVLRRQHDHAGDFRLERNRRYRCRHTGVEPVCGADHGGGAGAAVPYSTRAARRASVISSAR